MYKRKISDHVLILLMSSENILSSSAKLHKLTHIVMRKFQYGAAFERPPEFDGLAGGQAVQWQEYIRGCPAPVQFSPADAAHAHMIFLSERSRNAIGAGRKTQCFIFRHQCRSGVLRNHKAAVQSYIIHQQHGQSPFSFQQQITSPVGNITDLGSSKAGIIERQGQWLPWKLPPLMVSSA